MNDATTELDDVVNMCRLAADPRHDLIIAGEGNASMTTADGRLFVTATGSRLGSLLPEDLVEVDRSTIIAGLRETTNDAEWRDVVTSSAIGDRRPTVEVGIHAVLSETLGAGVVLHTHPTPVLACMAAGRSADLAEKRLLPDHVVMCGPTSWDLPYLDPGRELAAAVLARVVTGAVPPAVSLLGMHGILVHAPESRPALDISLMVAKCARMIISCPGEVRSLAASEITRIANREDERDRRRLLGLQAPTPPARPE